MLIKEFRIILPISVQEYEVAQLWSVAEASKNETGGGEGVEVIDNYPYDNEKGKGQYTKKLYHLTSRVPKAVKMLAPKGSLEFQEEAWNAYPYCKTVVTNPEYMGKGMEVSIESWYKEDFGELENVHELTPEQLRNREVIYIDIVNDPVSSKDYKECEDPSKFTPTKACHRGPLSPNWIEELKSGKKPGVPYMCAYKLVRAHFKWFGFQTFVESMIQSQEKRIFRNFNRQVYCWMDNWLGLTIEDIRRIEDEAKAELEELRRKGSIRGTKGD